MKINYIGIFACIIALISLTLPWYSITLSAQNENTTITADFSVYPYQVTGSTTSTITQVVATRFWFGSAAFASVMISAFTSAFGSLIAGRRGKITIVIAWFSALLSTVLFATGILDELSKQTSILNFLLGLFPPGLFGFTEESLRESFAYTIIGNLTFGVWVALFAAIVAIIAIVKHPKIQGQAQV